ncbi:MAG: DEAD/DEAH box helicase [Myxococcota bacterium]
METAPFADVPAPLQHTLTQRGFTRLTPVQQAVLQEEHAGRDLRISSQTGSGKTVAVGLLLAGLVERPEGRAERVCQPRAVVITPTRELAMQVASELSWLLKELRTRVLAVTGGTNVRAEQRALSHGAEIVVGTPGRLLDHLTQQVIDTSAVAAVVLDEADQMLDLGFRDELEAILEKLPTERRTHLMSATFSREVLALARRYQHDAVHVEGTTLGQANVDIAHVIQLVRPHQVTDALINLLLLSPDELTLVFARTRADVTNLAGQLAELGFSVAGLTGEMDQPERTRVMNAFRAGHLRTLVATDVAARGIDVPEVTRVIHVDAPTDSDVYTHRSGRTGRAGRKGTSILIVPPQGRDRVTRTLKHAGVRYTFAPVPDAQAILRASDDRLLAELTTPPPPTDDGAWEPHLHTLATRLLEHVEPLTLVHRLLARVGHHGPVLPRTVEPVGAPTPREPRERVKPEPRARKEHRVPEGGWVSFRLTSGSRFGMDARRLLATVCRRGNIRGSDVGAIDVGTSHSIFQVAAEVAEHFAEAAARPDPRDPRVRIEPLQEHAARMAREEERPAPRRKGPPPPGKRKPHRGTHRK